MAPIIFLAFARLYMPWQLVGQGGGLGNQSFLLLALAPFIFMALAFWPLHVFLALATPDGLFYLV